MIGSLFSGIGGLELGLEWAGLGPVAWQVEIDSFRRSVLAKHWPDAKRFSDVREVRSDDLSHVDIICGGFPCQDVSDASRGRGGGIDGERSGLWKENLRIISEKRPPFTVTENVGGAATRKWLPTVRRDLHMLGYRTRAIRIDARDVGAPHRRARVFVVGYADTQSQPASTFDGEVARLSKVAGNCWHWRKPIPGVVRMDDRVPCGLDRVRALGDAVVPQCAYVVGEMIARGA